jgi:hypothetical protein
MRLDCSKQTSGFIFSGRLMPHFFRGSNGSFKSIQAIAVTARYIDQKSAK